MSNPKTDFYVYMIRRPWDGVACYVGKGRGNRMYSHHRHGENHDNKRLASVYRKAKEMGLRVRSYLVLGAMSETDAFSLEMGLIKRIGRGRKGPLCNKTDGGEGQTGAIRSVSLRTHQSKVLKELYKDPELRKKVSIATKIGQERAGFRYKKSAAMSARMKNPEERERLRELSLAAWSDPEKRRERSEFLRGLYARDSGLRQRVRQSLIDGWADPLIREKRMRAVEAMSQPDVIARRAASIRRTKSTSESKEKSSRAAALSQSRIKADPERYALMLERRSASMKATLAAKRLSSSGA